MSKPPTLPQPLINRISEYGFARTDGASELERINRWMLLIDAIKDYAVEYADQQAKERADVPPGMALVPIEPTPEMIEASGLRFELAASAVYRAMLAASQDSAKETK